MPRSPQGTKNNFEEPLCNAFCRLDQGKRLLPTAANRKLPERISAVGEGKLAMSIAHCVAALGKFDDEKIFTTLDMASNLQCWSAKVVLACCKLPPVATLSAKDLVVDSSVFVAWKALNRHADNVAEHMKSKLVKRSERRTDCDEIPNCAQALFVKQLGEMETKFVAMMQLARKTLTGVIPDWRPCHTH